MSMLGQGRKAISQVGDPKLAVKGFVALTGTTVTLVPLTDYQGNAFTPSTTNPFGLVDIIMKSEATVTSQFSLYEGAVTQIAEWHVSPSATLMISFNSMLVFNDAIYAATTSADCTVTIVGVQN